MSTIIAKTLLRRCNITLVFIDTDGRLHYSNLAKYYVPGSVFKSIVKGGPSVEYQFILPNGTIRRIDGADVQFYDQLCNECLFNGVKEIAIGTAAARGHLDRLFIISPEGRLYYINNLSRLFRYNNKYYSEHKDCKMAPNVEVPSSGNIKYKCPFVHLSLIQRSLVYFECPSNFPILVSRQYGLFNHPAGLSVDKSITFEYEGRIYLLGTNGCYDIEELRIPPNPQIITVGGDLTLTRIIDPSIDSEPVFQYGDRYFNIKDNKIMSYAAPVYLHPGRATKPALRDV